MHSSGEFSRHEFLKAFLWIAGLQFLIFFVYFPAVYSIDGIFYLRNIVVYQEPFSNVDWESFAYGLLLRILLPPFQSFLGLSIIQLILSAGFHALGFLVIRKYSKSTALSGIWLIWIFLNPSAMNMFLLTERDIIFGYSLGIFAILLFLQAHHPKRNLHPVYFLFLALAILFKKEAILILLFLPAQMWCLEFTRSSIIKTTFASILFLCVFLNLGSILSLENNNTQLGGRYDSRAIFFNFIGLNNQYGFPLSVELERAIEKNFLLIRNAESGKIEDWRYREKVDTANLREFSWYAGLYLVKHFDSYIEYRYDLLAGKSWIRYPLDRFREEYADRHTLEQIAEHPLLQQQLAAAYFPAIQKKANDLQDSFCGTLVYRYFFSQITGFLLFLFLCLYAIFKRNLIFYQGMVVCAPFFLLLLVIWLISPHVTPKYTYYFKLVSGAVVPIIFCSYFATRKNSKNPCPVAPEGSI